MNEINEINEIDASTLARGLAARRRRIAHVCPVCGKTFTGTVRARYCSDACSQRATYARHAEERRAQKRAYRERLRAQADAGRTPDDSSRSGGAVRGRG
jgi:hypothetical protein